MKKHILIFFTFILLFSCGQNEIDLSQVSTRNGLAYQVNKSKPFTGNVVKKIGNEQILISGSYKDGKKEGEWLEYFNNGQLKKKEGFKNSVYDGIVEVFTENGQKLSSQNYSDNQQNGVSEFYNANGVLLKKASYSNGKLNGNYIENFDNNNPKIITTYKDNSIISDYSSFYQNGNKKLEYSINDDSYNGDYIEYNDDGSSYTHYLYANGKKINKGTWKKYWNNDNPVKKSNNDYSIVKFDNNGKPSQAVKFYYKNGRIKREGNYSSIEPDVREGKHIWYYDNGDTKLIGNFKNNSRDGVWKLYYNKNNYAGNKLCQLAEYKNGKFNGKFEWYNIDYLNISEQQKIEKLILLNYKYGRKFQSGFINSTGDGGRWWKVEGQFVNGKFNGLFKIWDKRWGSSKPRNRYKKHIWSNNKMTSNGESKSGGLEYYFNSDGTPN